MKLLPTCAALIVLANSISAADIHEAQIRLRQTKYAIPAKAASAAVIPDCKADRIVVYSASWCFPCQRLKPIVASLKQEGYRVDYLDVDRDIDKLKYEHTSVPTIYFLRGEAVIKKETGFRSKEQIVRTLVLDHDLRRVEVAPLIEARRPVSKFRRRTSQF